MADEETRRSLLLNRSDTEWFEQAYGDGKLSWAVQLLMSEFRKQHVMLPQDYANIAARQLKMKVEDL